DRRLSTVRLEAARGQPAGWVGRSRIRHKDDRSNARRRWRNRAFEVGVARGSGRGCAGNQVDHRGRSYGVLALAAQDNGEIRDRVGARSYQDQAANLDFDFPVGFKLSLAGSNFPGSTAAADFADRIVVGGTGRYQRK